MNNRLPAVEDTYIAPQFGGTAHPGQPAAIQRHRRTLHRTLLDKHFRVEGRTTWFETIEEMQAVLDD